MALSELVAALTILAIGVLGLAAAMGGGFRQIALGRQRQSAAEIGNGRIEHLRNLPYVNVAVSSDVVHNTDPEHPDYFVKDADNTFDYSGSGTFEPLIEDATSGQVTHFESPVVVGSTTLTVYQYVTWVDDPDIAGTQNYRRVTVVVQYNAPAVGSGISRMVRSSSFFTPGGVALGGQTTAIGQGTAPTASPSAAPTSGSCSPSDSNAPSGSFEIQSGIVSEVGFTPSVSVTLRFLGVSDPCTPISLQFSNDNVTFSNFIVYDALNPSASWALPPSDGVKTVYGKIRDGRGNVGTLSEKQTTLDTTKPGVPGTLSRTLSCSGTSRTVGLAWGASTDTHFRGYRIYKSIDNAPWLALGTVSGTTGSDTDSKLYDSLRYYVVGYDKAGNESDATNTITLSKNQCS